MESTLDCIRPPTTTLRILFVRQRSLKNFGNVLWIILGYQLEASSFYITIITKIPLTVKLPPCLNGKWNPQRILHRWYMTPMRLQKLYPETLCWRECQHAGNLLHLLWSCDSLKRFWQGISTFISEISGIQFILTLTLALLSIGSEAFNFSVRTVVLSILFTAWTSITRDWKSVKMPKIDSVIARVNIQCQYEKQIAYKEQGAPIFHKKMGYIEELLKGLCTHFF